MSLLGPPSVSRLAAKKDVKGLIKALQYPKDAAIPVASASALGELRPAGRRSPPAGAPAARRAGT